MEKLKWGITILMVIAFFVILSSKQSKAKKFCEAVFAVVIPVITWLYPVTTSPPPPPPEPPHEAPTTIVEYVTEAPHTIPDNSSTHTESDLSNVGDSSPKTYQEQKAELVNTYGYSNIEAYLIDLNVDGNDEMVVTYSANNKPALAIYYTDTNGNINELFNKTAAASVSNENPTICYMITEESSGYSLRERIVQEKRTRNTYYRFENNSLSSIRDIYEDDYSAVITELQKYPVVITTDPVHYAVTNGISQPSKI